MKKTRNALFICGLLLASCEPLAASNAFRGIPIMLDFVPGEVASYCVGLFVAELVFVLRLRDPKKFNEYYKSKHIPPKRE